jgi:hypothetical protein
MSRNENNFFAALALTIIVVWLFGPKQKAAFLLVTDTSKSSQHSQEINKSLNTICGDDVKGKLDQDNSALFGKVSFADHAESSRQWNQSNKVSTNSCMNLQFDALRDGTNLESGVLESQQVLNRLDKDQEAIRLVVIIVVDADEKGNSGRTRDDVITSIKSLYASIEKRKGKLIIISGSYNGLRRDLQSGLQENNITYCSPKSLQDCELPTVIKEITRPSDWTYSFRKIINFGKA